MGMTYVIKFVGDRELRLEDVDDVDTNSRAKILLFRRDLGEEFETLAEVSIYNMLYYKVVS